MRSENIIRVSSESLKNVQLIIVDKLATRELYNSAMSNLHSRLSEFDALIHNHTLVTDHGNVYLECLSDDLELVSKGE